MSVELNRRTGATSSRQSAIAIGRGVIMGSMAVAFPAFASVAEATDGVGGPCYYEVTVLDLIPDCGFGQPGSTTPRAIADNGWITGRYPQCNDGGDGWAMLNTGGTAVEPLIPPFVGVWRAEGRGISSTGVVVGTMDIDGVGTRGFLFDHNAGEWTQIDTIVGGTFSELEAVNDSGLAVGRAGNNVVGPASVAIIWSEGELIDLSAELGTASSDAQDVNDEGSIVGWMGASSSTSIAFLRESDGTLHVLEPPGNFQSVQGVAVNRWGDVAGQGRWQASPSDPIVLHAFLWNPFTDEFLDLGTLAGSTFSRPFDINDRREIVGLCNNPQLTDQVAFLWRDGEMVAVESLDAPGNDIEMRIAYGITHLGSIAGVLYEPGSIITFAGVLNPPVSADLNDDCVVDFWDLIMLLTEWGAGPSNADLNGDGSVNVSDLLHLLARWS